MTRRTPAQYDWDAQEFDERILTKHYTAPRRDKVRFIVAHHMTVLGKGDGKANDKCYSIWQNRQASAHYGVDGDYLMQFVWDKNAAWSTAKTYGNHAGISIEHANSSLGPGWEISEKTWKNGAKLAAYLHVTHKLGRPTSTGFGTGGTMRTHQSFYATSCPGPWFKTNWSKYVKEAQRVYDEITKTKPPVVVPPTPKPTSKPHTYISCNLAGNDTVGKGKRTRVARSKKDIPNYLAPKKPTWFHFQECYDDMLPGLDKGLAGYARVAAGGRGRESYYDKSAGITILEAKLLNVKHAAPGKDSTKEHLVIAWEDADGFCGVYVNFHNSPPSDGTKYQPLQLLDCMADGTAMCDRHGIPRTNLAVTGDANFPDAAEFVKSRGWRESIHIAKKAIDLMYRTLNGWLARLVKGDRIDVDVFLPGAIVDEAELLFGAVISDHWPHRVIHRFTK